MQKTVSVISVAPNVDVATKAGGTYNCTVFSFNDGQNQVRNMSNQYMDPTLKSTLHSLESGDLVNIEIGKNAKGFIEISSITKASGNEKVAAKPAASSDGFSSNARQDSIVFQNAMAHAVKISLHIASEGSDKRVDVKDIIFLAKKIALVSRNPKLDEFAKSLKPKLAVVKEAAPTPAPAEDTTTTEIVDDDIPFGN